MFIIISSASPSIEDLNLKLSLFCSTTHQLVVDKLWFWIHRSGEHHYLKYEHLIDRDRLLITPEFMWMWASVMLHLYARIRTKINLPIINIWLKFNRAPLSETVHISNFRKLLVKYQTAPLFWPILSLISFSLPAFKDTKNCKYRQIFWQEYRPGPYSCPH